MSSFSKNLISLRKSKSLTQQQAAIAVGLDFETYQKLEFAMIEPDLDTINKVANFFEVDAADLQSSNMSDENKTQRMVEKVKGFADDTTSEDLKSVCTTQSTNASSKSRGGAAALAWFLGAFGAHNFYLKNTGRAIAQLILTITCVGAIISSVWAFVEFIIILCGSMKDGEGKEVKKW